MSKPNILIIVTDDQGYADLSAYPHHAPDIHTPNMDRLAARGTVFSQAYVTAPVCSPSRAGWNTGQYQQRWDPECGWAPGLPSDIRNIAEHMKDAGYATGRFGKNDYGAGYFSHEAREYPLNHGYDEFLGFSAHAHDYFLMSEDIEKRTPDPKGHSAHLGPLMHNDSYKSIEDGYTTEVFTDAMIDFMDRHREEPFFGVLSYNSVHHLIHQVPKRYLDKYGVTGIPNYDPESKEKYEEYFQKYISLDTIPDNDMRGYYLANLDCMDDNIGRVLDTLEEHSLTESTLVIFFSDNGGSPTTGACNLPLAGSKFTLWEGGIRVPFIASWPGTLPTGTMDDRPVSTLDILPTCHQAAGIATPDALDGHSLAILAEEDVSLEQTERTMFWKWMDSYAVRDGDWKLLYKGGKRARRLHKQIITRDELLEETCLFNLREDPAESVDLSREHSEIVERLQEAYDAWAKTVVGSRAKKDEQP